jgi:hypothetical protein
MMANELCIGQPGLFALSSNILTWSAIKGRLQRHKKSKSKKWTHFSVYEVWDNISKEQVEELEGLFRHIYRKDSAANSLNAQGSYGTLLKIRRNSPEEWQR